LILKDLYQKVRKTSVDICAPLQIEDYVIQSCLEVSPPKWHLAHTTWFYETLVLGRYQANFKEFNPEFNTYFNSYYKSFGKHWLRDQRGILSRPGVGQIMEYRNYVDQKILEFLNQSPSQEALEILELGLHHEQQHQELLLMDIKNIFSVNNVTYSLNTQPASTQRTDGSWTFNEGVYEFGHNNDGFSYDNEGPYHKSYIHSFELEKSMITNGDFLKFIEDGGYQKELLWLSDGLTYIKENNINSPLYWEKGSEGWNEFTLYGKQPLDLNTPVSHISYYEAQAFALWAGKRLPTEYEWELAAKTLQEDTQAFLEGQTLTPTQSLKGSLWQWSSSSYDPYPGYSREAGPLGEYNGKFMCNQRVLKGGSFATSNWHYRNTYRNFFYPKDRWQFCGLRLAKDA